MTVLHSLWKNTFKSCTVTNIQNAITKCGIYNYSDNGVEVHQRGTVFILDPLAWGVFYISKINNGGLIATLGHYKQYRNIYPSKLQTSECKNNLEILCDKK